MLPDKPVNHRLTALNTAYLVSAFIGCLYFLYGFWAIRRPTVSTTPVPAAVLQAHHYILLFVCLFEAGIGIFIFQAVKKTFLFFQSLATMFVFAGHGLVIYHFHTETTKGQPDMDMIAWSFYFFVPAIILHALARMEHRFKKIKVTLE